MNKTFFIFLILSNTVLSKSIYDDTLLKSNNIKYLVSINLKLKDSLDSYSVFYTSDNDTIVLSCFHNNISFNVCYTEKEFEEICIKHKLKSLLKLYLFVKNRRKYLFLFHKTRCYLSWDDKFLKNNNKYLVDIVINNLETKQVDLITDNYKIGTFQYLFFNLPWKIIPSIRLFLFNKYATLEIYNSQSIINQILLHSPPIQ
jgi:hypothetical protein